MTTVNYPTPVTVNGYSCKNCTDVDYAKKHIDPARPADGPYGVNAKDRPSSASPQPAEAAAVKTAPPAVTFGGALSALSASPPPPSATQGLRLDVSA